MDQITRKLQKYYGLDRYEDGLQEAFIRAWKDIENGYEDYWHIVHRAVHWGRAFIFDSDRERHPTGDLGRSREGQIQSQGEASREKIRNFCQEYRALHDKTPTHKVIAEGTGLTPKTVSHHVRRMKESRSSNIPIRRNRLDRREFTQVHLSRLLWATAGEDSQSLSRFFSCDSFEDEIVGQKNFEDMVNLLPNEGMRQALTLRYVYGYTGREIGLALGASESNAQSKAHRLLQRAHRDLRAFLAPEVSPPVTGDLRPKCRRGHVRTPENTYKRSDGNQTCNECRRVKGWN